MEKILICVVHLKPLPGSPNYESWEEVIEDAIRDARAIEEGGADALIIENFGDVPYTKEVGKEVVACMAVIANEVRRETSIGLGINVLRNDGIAALAVAKAAKADFVRVNQPTFASLAPEGFLEGIAAELARYRRMIDCDAMIFADVCVKHAHHFVSVEEYVENAERAFADALIATGRTTGDAVSVEDLKVLRRVPLPLLAGSGVTPENAGKIMKYCDGAIVGSYIKRKGRVDAERVRRIARAVKG